MEDTLTNRLCSTSLISITGTLALTNNFGLSNLTMPALTSVGSIHIKTGLENLDFGNGITSVKSVFIAHTMLRSIDSLGMASVENLTLNNNIQLDQVSLPVRYITSAFMIETDSDKT